MDKNLAEIDALLRQEERASAAAAAAAPPLRRRTSERELPAASSRVSALEAQLAEARAQLALRAQPSPEDIAALDLELERSYSAELEAKLKVRAARASNGSQRCVAHCSLLDAELSNDRARTLPVAPYSLSLSPPCRPPRATCRRCARRTRACAPR